MLPPQLRRIHQLPSLVTPKTSLSGAYTVWDVPLGPVGGAYKTFRGTAEQYAEYLATILPGSPGGPAVISQPISLAGAQQLRLNAPPAAQVVSNILYAVEGSGWNGGTVTTTVHVHGLNPSTFAPVGYVLDTQGVQQWVSVDVAAGLVDTEAVRDAHIIQYGELRLTAGGALQVPLLLGPAVTTDAVIEELLVPLAGTTPTPATTPPGVEPDDTANTLTVTHPYGMSATEAQVNFSSTWLAYTAIPGYNASTGKIDVGNVARPAGYFTLRTAADAATGRAASVTVPSAAFTATTAPGKPNLLTNTNLADASAWTPGDLGVVAGQLDPAGGTTAVLAVPNTTNTDNHNLRSAQPFSGYAAGRAMSYVLEGKPGGYRFVTLWVVQANNSASIAMALFDLQTGNVVNNPSGTAVASVPLAGGYYRVQLDFTANGNDFFLFPKIWDNTTGSSYAGDGTSGVYLVNPALQDA